MSNMLVRAISGFAYVVLVLFACFSGLNGHLSMAAIIAVLGVLEWFEFSDKPSIQLRDAAIIVSILLGILAFNFSLSSGESVAILGILTILTFFTLALLMLFAKDGLKEVFHSVFALVYIGIPITVLPGISVIHGDRFPWILASIFIMIWSNDTFAYLSGRTFGKHKLFPRISPNKTWEGFFGGIIATLIAAGVFQYFFDFLSPYAWLGLGLIVSIFGNIGDLFESALKRNFGLKDSGNLMPGHGGILDRLDSLLFVLPIAYFYLRIIEYITT